MGVAVSGHHGQDTATLLQRADIAMYVAKDQSRGIFVYDPAADRHSPAKLAALGDLRHALDTEASWCCTTSPRSTSARVTSWRRGSGASAPPAARPRDARRVHAVRGAHRADRPAHLQYPQRGARPGTAWCEQGRPLTVAVNLSARNLLDEHLPDQVAELLAAHEVAPKLLVLEVTETAVVTEPLRAQQLLKRLSALGIRISIDDFGAGYT